MMNSKNAELWAATKHQWGEWLDEACRNNGVIVICDLRTRKGRDAAEHFVATNRLETDALKPPSEYFCFSAPKPLLAAGWPYVFHAARLVLPSARFLIISDDVSTMHAEATSGV